MDARLSASAHSGSMVGALQHLPMPCITWRMAHGTHTEALRPSVQRFHLKCPPGQLSLQPGPYTLTLWMHA